MADTLDIYTQFQTLAEREEPNEYNFSHFRAKHLAQDAGRTIEGRGIAPGEVAPHFDLPIVGGGSVSLSSLRGKPVLLHFGSLS